MLTMPSRLNMLNSTWHRFVVSLAMLCFTGLVDAQPAPPVHVVQWFDAETLH
jgi:hypothetical protein